jgi:class 3 adenylate cyclase
MRSATQRHGGTVEKFIGDAVVGVFGVPEAHEEDTLRAVRSAFEMQKAAAELDRDIDDAEVRIGIAIDCGEAFADESAATQGRLQPLDLPERVVGPMLRDSRVANLGCTRCVLGAVGMGRLEGKMS